MKRFVRWAVALSCLVTAGCAVLLALIFTPHPPQEFLQLRSGMTQQEVNELLGGEPNLLVRKEEPDKPEIVRTPPDIQDMVVDNLELLQAGNNKLAVGHSYQVWDGVDGGILVIFAEDGTVLDKEYRKKKAVPFWQRLLDLVW